MSARVKSLILSGAYVNAELANEFGLLPPAFLPLGLKRLFEHQVERLAADGFELHLSVPEGFEVSPADQKLLESAGVRLLRVNPDASLAAAILSCLEQVGADGPLEILHGDTLIPPPRPWAGDAYSVGDARDGYSWAAAEIEDGRIVDVASLPPDQEMEDHAVVLSGYFAFEDAAAFRDQLTRPGANFVRAVAAYAKERRVQPLNGGGWLDFGHLQTFFRSRRRMASARAFNTLAIDDRVAVKRSSQAAKLAAEAAWLAEAPPPVRVYTGRLIDQWREEDGAYAYSTEYEYLPTLAELYIFGRLNRASWSRILDSCVAYLRLASSITSDEAPADALRRLTIAKTAQRLATHAEAAGLDLDAPNRLDGAPAPSLRAIADAMAAVVAGQPDAAATLMHGDFCFSNILYNSRAERIRLIDPRGGIEEGANSLYGDFRYDVAKLAHSIVGRYDLIMAGRYELTRDGDGCALSFADDADRDWLEEAFAEKVLGRLGLEPRLIWAVMITLFLSMLPLHADGPQRQAAFVANALRLHRRFFGDGG